MAKQLKQYTPSKPKGPPPKYPWDEWFNGGIYALIKDEDFTINVDDMISYIKHRATKLNKNVSVFKDNPTTIIITPAREASNDWSTIKPSK